MCDLEPFSEIQSQISKMIVSTLITKQCFKKKQTISVCANNHDFKKIDC